MNKSVVLFGFGLLEVVVVETNDEEEDPEEVEGTKGFEYLENPEDFNL